MTDATKTKTFFTDAVAAIEAAQVKIEESLKTLWVDFDPATGSGGTYWHAAGSGVAQTALNHLEDVKALLVARDWSLTPSDQPSAAPATAASTPSPQPEPLPPVEATTGEVSGVGHPIPEPVTTVPPAPPEVAATPAALAHAEATGVDLTQVEGSGKEGTITKADVAAVAATEEPPA